MVMIYDSCLESLVTNHVSVLDFEALNKLISLKKSVCEHFTLEYSWHHGCNAACWFDFLQTSFSENHLDSMYILKDWNYLNIYAAIMKKYNTITVLFLLLYLS